MPVCANLSFVQLVARLCHEADTAALNYTVPVVGDDLVGWCDLTWKETVTGWNIVVDVNPNNTGQERSGTFTVYAAYNEESRDRAINEGVFDPDLVAATTVVVKQTAGGDVEVNTNIRRIDFTDNIECNTPEGKLGVYYGGFYLTSFGPSTSFDREDIKVTDIGSDGSFSCTATKNSEYKTTDYWKIKRKSSITFDVGANDGNFGKVKSMVYTIEEERYQVLYDFTARVNCTIKASDLPVSFVGDDGSGVRWRGTAEDGVRLNEYSFSCTVVDNKGDTKLAVNCDTPTSYEPEIWIMYGK